MNNTVDDTLDALRDILIAEGKAIHVSVPRKWLPYITLPVREGSLMAHISLPVPLTEVEYQRILKCLEIEKDALVFNVDMEDLP